MKEKWQQLTKGIIVETETKKSFAHLSKQEGLKKKKICSGNSSQILMTCVRLVLCILLFC